MRIRASVLTPILAMLTVVVFVGVGIALGQSRGGDASATLLGSTPSFAVAAVAETAAVADAEPASTGAISLEQPVVQSVEADQSVPVDPVIVAGGQGTTTVPTTKSPTKSPAKPPATTPPTSPPTTDQDTPDPPETDTDEDGSGSDEPDESPDEDESDSD